MSNVTVWDEARLLLQLEGWKGGYDAQKSRKGACTYTNGTHGIAC